MSTKSAEVQDQHQAQLGANLINEVGRVLAGQDTMVLLLLTGLLAGGHG